MPDLDISTLHISGFRDQPVPNRYFRLKGEPSMLGVFIPGLHYSCDMPLLYYTASLLLHHGADVLKLYPDYSSQEFQSQEPFEKLQWLSADAHSAIEQGVSQRTYSRICVAAKSLGALSLAHLVANGAHPQAITLWLTPLLRQPWLVETALQITAPAVFVCGTADNTYHEPALERIRQATGAETILVQNANHSLEIADDPIKSLAAMQKVLAGLDAFLDRLGINPA